MNYSYNLNKKAQHECYCYLNSYSNTSDPFSQSLPSLETATTSFVSCIPTDSNSDQSDTEDFQRPLSKQPRIEASVVNLDVAHLARRRSSLTDSEKYDFYCDHFIPDIDYKFPREGGRGFLYRYLRKYNWLAYSRQENGAYCLPCVLFARRTDAQKGKGVFVEAAFTNFKKVYELCDFHVSREYHKDAVAACDAFVGVMSGRRESVAVQLSQEFRDTVMKNRQMLRSIVKNNNFVWSSEYCSPWSSQQCHRFGKSRCTVKPWQLLGFAQLQSLSR